MTRQQKYPDTFAFHYHNQNPKHRITGDCVVRAISTATGIEYDRVVVELAEVQIATGYSLTSNEAMDRYLKSLGWVKHKQPRKVDNTKYTGLEFSNRIQMGYEIDFDGCPNDRIVANVGGHHVAAIMDGKVWDTWDSTDGCIGNYWTKGGK